MSALATFAARGAFVPATIDFRAVFDSLTIPTMLLDHELRYVDMNRAYLDTTMRTRESLIGVYVMDAFPNEGPNGVRLERSFRKVRDEGVVDVLPWLHYAIALPPERGGGYDDRYWSCTHIPIRDAKGKVAYVLQHTQDVTEIRRLRDAAFGKPPSDQADQLSQDMLRRVETIQTVNETLAAERSYLRRLFMQAPGFMCVLRGPNHVYEMVNDAYRTLVGRDDLVGKSVIEAIPEAEAQGYVALLDRVFSTGEPFIGRGMRLFFQRAEGMGPEERFLDFIYQPITEVDGSISGIFVEGSDITERVQAERQQKLLMDELNHRVKNTLATVQAIVMQTLRTAASPKEFARSFEARIGALSKSHALLTQERWRGADLREILEMELRPYSGARVSLAGSPLRLAPRAALTLGLVVHELTTNAVKYGAFSNESGHLDVEWRVEKSGGPAGLTLVWRESGAPPAGPPERRGFGRRLIERSIRGELKGAFDVDYRLDGVCYEFRIPLPDIIERLPA